MKDKTAPLSAVAVDPLVSHWETGEVIRMCRCDGPSLPIYTDGKREWAHCEKCGKRWDVSLEKLPNPPF